MNELVAGDFKGLPGLQLQENLLKITAPGNNIIYKIIPSF